MKRWPKLLAKFTVACFVAFVVDGCLIRDPLVNLGNGYIICAPSGSSPCSLVYFESFDSRTRSPWLVLEVEHGYTLHHRDTREFRDFASKAECREAALQVGARPPIDLKEIHHITGFDSDGQLAIGDSLNGYFILDTGADELETFRTSAEWADAVRTRTNLNPNRMRDPRGWLVQYRAPGHLAVIATILAMGSLWIAAPMIWKNQKAAVAGPTT